MGRMKGIVTEEIVEINKRLSTVRQEAFKGTGIIAYASSCKTGNRYGSNKQSHYGTKEYKWEQSMAALFFIQHWTEKEIERKEG